VNYAGYHAAGSVADGPLLANPKAQEPVMSPSDNCGWIATLAALSRYLCAVLLLPMLLLAQPRPERLSDEDVKEVAATASSIAAAAARFRSELDRAAFLTKPDKEAARNDAEVLIDHANAVKSRTGNGKPATSELRDLVEQVRLLQAFVTMHSIPETDNWHAVVASLAKLQQAFGLAQ
jgi:hypothetical protein